MFELCTKGNIITQKSTFDYFLITGDASGNIYYGDLSISKSESNKKQMKLSDQKDSILSLLYCQNINEFFSASCDGSVLGYIYNESEYKRVTTIPYKYTKYLDSIQYDNEKHLLYIHENHYGYHCISNIDNTYTFINYPQIMKENYIYTFHPYYPHYIFIYFSETSLLALYNIHYFDLPLLSFIVPDTIQQHKIISIKYIVNHNSILFSMEKQFFEVHLYTQQVISLYKGKMINSKLITYNKYSDSFYVPSLKESSLYIYNHKLSLECKKSIGNYDHCITIPNSGLLSNPVFSNDSSLIAMGDNKGLLHFSHI
ncbi:hypothetical protein WA158_007045 [Blastocystis sp. Blastoise]